MFLYNIKIYTAEQLKEVFSLGVLFWSFSFYIEDFFKAFFSNWKNFYVCVLQASFTSSSVGKQCVGMIITANMMNGDLLGWILFGWELY